MYWMVGLVGRNQKMKIKEECLKGVLSDIGSFVIEIVKKILSFRIGDQKRAGFTG